jgi:hypothetical protein
MSDAAVVRPTLMEVPTTTIRQVRDFVAAYPRRELGLILRSGRLAAADVAAALGSAPCVLFLGVGVNPLPYVGAVGAANTVTISDNFRALERNADYFGEEWLANNHVAYVASGQWGFSDFTVLPGRFTSGGGPVGAAAFHLSYRASDRSLWVQHFVSDETDRNVGNSSSKLLEAMAHLENQIAATPRRFVMSPALRSYRDQDVTGSPTNLSSNKRLQVEHHIFTVARELGVV